MMDRYNKETSQIHAPADLIRKTKEAVREEEQRIAREQIQQNAVVPPKHSDRKVYKWALPVAAAAVCLILLNVGVMRLGNGMDKSQSGASMDMASGAAESNDMGMQLGTSGIAEEMAETASEEPISRGSSLRIEEVDETPAFYGEPDTECFTIHGIKIYVAQNTDDTWTAYIRKNRHEYVISGELTQENISREAYAEEAYELLMETIGSAE